MLVGVRRNRARGENANEGKHFDHDGFVIVNDGGQGALDDYFATEFLANLTDDGGGGIFVGDSGYLTYETYGNNPKVYPDAAAARADSVAKSVPRITTSHEANWAQACKGEGTASSPFDYAARLTETMLLGVVALRAGQSQKILYDGNAMRVTNLPDANRWLTREYREGWQPWSASEALAAI